MVTRGHLALVLLLGGSGQAQTGSDPVELYKTRIQPLLASKCYACHTQSALGGLRLDSRPSVVKGGNSGPAVIPGRPADSLLIQAVTHTHEKIKMPPAGRLSDSEIADLKRWVESGAHFNSTEAPPSPESDLARRRNFWSFQAPRKSPLPAVKNKSWARTPIDRFILAALEEKGLAPAPPADRATLLRRVTLDLTGLPPTPEEYRAFREDSSPEAFAGVVDRLLASERYGERWGRHWLDVARYADADGISVAPQPFANAWRYRDWVVEAFNKDMPFDLLIRAQIAGDLIETPGERRLTPGVGYLALGPWFHTVVEPVKARADELQDRIDVVSRGFLGLTVACARCHDHKYDPIPTRDYYALGGVLSSTEYKEEPLAPAETVAAYDKAGNHVKVVEQQVKDFLDSERKGFRERQAKHSGRYLLAAWQRKQKSGEPVAGLDAKILDRWIKYLDRTHDHSLLHFWPALAAGASRQQAEAAARDFQQMVDSLILEHRELTEHNERIIEASKKSTDPYDIYCKGCRAETKALAREKYVFLGDLFDAKRKTEGEERAAGVLYLNDKELEAYLDAAARKRLEELRAELAAAKKAMPERYPFLHVLADTKEPRDMPLHRRGDPYSLGDIVPRHFLSVLGKTEPAALTGGSGRLELANQIASPANPLTARVIVNRIWHHHFGAGLVRTLSNFGAAGDRPSHPELLDYLAVQFIEDGWSIKKLHRQILLSSAYAISSQGSEQALAADADNRLLSRFPRRRLDVEALRDSMLFVSGKLQLAKGGPAVKWDKDFHRRTLYGEVSRFRTERLLTLFDFPDPSIHAEKRVATNTPVQRLFFLNSEFIKQQAEGLCARVRAAVPVDTEAQVRAFYDLLFGRAPEPRELAVARRFLDPAAGDAALAEFAQVLLSSSEFSFVD
ncbi:MAG TPA: PSD1 and planctomycete cytochrome C domain-containing protein [Bryobacteraceae bacterium]|nr:PSD1 and planctomycete cytochrome C domain-containing protein [Bryobacteraceae bacterium]